METDTALVGADGAVHLDAVAAVDLDFAFVVEPRHTENDDPFGFGNAFENLHLLEDRAGHDMGASDSGHLADGLMELRFTRVAAISRAMKSSTYCWACSFISDSILEGFVFVFAPKINTFIGVLQVL